MCVSLIRSRIYRLSELLEKPMDDVQTLLDGAEDSEHEKLLRVVMKLSQLLKDDLPSDARRLLGVVIYDAAQGVYMAI